MMGVDDFTTMLAYLVRVSWAAAAGQLHLASAEESFPATPSKEINVPIGPSTVLSKKLASGICAAQTDVSSKVRGLYLGTGACYCVGKFMRLVDKIVFVSRMLPLLEKP